MIEIFKKYKDFFLIVETINTYSNELIHYGYNLE
jgi:hypothetical protein